MGICTTSGPRQPMGLTPASRYNRMVSCDTRARSLPYLSLISCILGWRELIARIWRSCLRVSGKVATRTKMVNRMMAKPIWLKQITYNTTKVLSSGRMMNSAQRKPMASKGPYSLSGIYWSVALDVILNVEAPHFS